jgi:itaconyl-CoA hydratase
MALTGNDNYFEDFEIGQIMRHARGKTMCENDNVGITLQVLNTADAHFNEHITKDTLGGRLQFGGVTIAMIIGLAMQDTGENALQELALNNIRLKAPVMHGDTLYAFTEVLEKNDGQQDDAGEVLFHHWGINQKDEIVFEGDRRVLVKRKSHFLPDQG